MKETQTFTQLDIHPALLRGIEDVGFETMTPIQQQAIPVLLEGKDVIGQAQTGTGKTAAFGLPILEKIDPENKHIQAIILCPTRELALQAASEMRSFAKYMQGVKTLPIYGGQPIDYQIKALKGVQVVIGTPGRIMDHMNRRTIRMNDVKMVVLDEADEMLNMGFREDMEYILGAIKHEHQTCLFSATMPKPILDITDLYQVDPIFIKVTREQLTIDKITQYYYAVKREFRYEALKRLLLFHQYTRCIVFCNTKATVDDVTKKLKDDGFNANGLHGDLNQKQRDYVMKSFRNGNLDIFVCTDVAARGIDVDDVEAVINFDVPQELEYYVHRVGRTGRAGKEGVAHTLVASKNFNRLRDIEKMCHIQLIEARIPGFEEINKNHEKEVLRQILAKHEEQDDFLLSTIYSFCKTNHISLEEFALASFKKLLGETTIDDTIEVNLPSKEQKKKSRNRRDRKRKDTKKESKDRRKKDSNRDKKSKDKKRDKRKK